LAGVCRIRIVLTYRPELLGETVLAAWIGHTSRVCGIAGIVGKTATDDDVLVRMARAMIHRGPDDQGIWSDRTAGLAFRRLAVIDLDPRSNQPLHFEGLHLTFNGEIYNYLELRSELQSLGHAFVTAGDGEVLIHAWREWGEAALDRLNGMFAMALWDEREQSLTLASDPFGEKPLYYCEAPGRLAFGSDIRALIEAVDGLGAPDERALEVFVARKLMPAPDGSFFAGVKRLPAAHLLRWRAGNVAVLRYWAPRRIEVPTHYEDAATELRELLVDAIRVRLRSDVPVGTSLSGGLDSSAVVALSAKLGHEQRRHAFTATFPGYERDEWAFAQQAAAAADVLEHHAVEPKSDQLLDDLETLIRDQEEPIGSTSIYAQWRVNQAAREAGVVVLLDGQGADELFGGYPWMVGTAAMAGGPRAIARALRAGGSQRATTLRMLMSAYMPDRLAGVYRRRSASPYVSPDVVARTIGFEPPVPVFSEGSAMRRELLLETFVTSLPTLLRYADRSSMAHSREVRLPYLDRRVAEFALSLPASFLWRDGFAKAILRDAVRGLVPDPILARRDKVAFDPPEASWLATPAWRERIAGVLLDPATRARGIYDTAAIEADLRVGAWRDHGALWRAFCAEMWKESFRPRPLGPVATTRPR
jgi:asparagine synthase (glutamine-hydrolysing)